MSLINQMLTDLDKRKTRSQDGGDSVPEPIPVAAAAHPNRKFLILGVGAAVAVVIALVILWSMGSNDSSGPQTAAIERQEMGEEASAEVTPAENQPLSAQTTDVAVGIEPKAPLTSANTPAETVAPVQEVTPLPDSKEQVSAQVAPPPQRQSAAEERHLPPIEPVIDVEPEPAVSSYKKPVKRATSKKESSFAKGQRYLSQGRLAEAEAALRKALDQAANNHQARELLAGLLIRGGRNDEALHLLQEGAARAPQRPGFALLQARILMQQGDRAQAVTLLEEVARSGSGNKQVITLLAVLYQQQKQHEQALELYRMLIEREPGLASNWVGAAISLEALGNSEEALSAYQRAVSLPNLAQALRAYATDRIENLGQNR
jgi:tetratricopeptide (TPR) repeat protein